MTTQTIPSPMVPQVKTRPTGVTILAILEALGALSFILLGVGAMAAGTVTGIFGAIFAIFGAIFLIVGLIELVIAYGLWTGKSWAWFIALVFGFLSILFGLVSLVGGSMTGIVGLLIAALIVYYLLQPNVKAYFKT